MAARVTTVGEMLKLGLAGDLWDVDDGVDAWNAEQAADRSETVEEFANNLIQEQLLTRYQARQLLAGRNRGYLLGDYRLLHAIGVGGMGRVFLAVHRPTGAYVAVKVLTDSKIESGTERFAREARAGKALRHDNMVQTLGFERANERPYLVMEFIDGHNLQEWVRRFGPMPWPQACDAIRQAAAGLAHAGQHGVIHRDIKPANLLLARTGAVKILDMGLARVLAEEAEGVEPLSMRYDERALGTADYVAPEQLADSHAADGKADIYSLGLTFHYLLTGQTAAGAGSIASKLLWHVEAAPPPVRQLRPDVPVEVQATLDWMIAKKPEARLDAFRVRERLKPFAQEMRVDGHRDLKAALHAPLTFGTPRSAAAAEG